jgi:hypothetical protein
MRTNIGVLPLSEAQRSQGRSSGSVWAESFMLLRTCLFREPTLRFCLWHDGGLAMAALRHIFPPRRRSRPQRSRATSHEHSGAYHGYDRKKTKRPLDVFVDLF